MEGGEVGLADVLVSDVRYIRTYLDIHHKTHEYSQNSESELFKVLTSSFNKHMLATSKSSIEPDHSWIDLVIIVFFSFSLILIHATYLYLAKQIH